MLLSIVLGVLFLVQFNNFDRTTGFCWSYTLMHSHNKQACMSIQPCPQASPVSNFWLLASDQKLVREKAQNQRYLVSHFEGTQTMSDAGRWSYLPAEAPSISWPVSWPSLQSYPPTCEVRSHPSQSVFPIRRREQYPWSDLAPRHI